MDSLQDILNRVLENAAEKTAQRVQPMKNRRPLRDPQTDTVGFFNDISSAVKNIRSPEAARALQSQTVSQDAVNDAGSQPGDSTNESPSSSPAVNTRRTTLKDDANVIGEMTKAAAQIVQQVTTAGKAIGDFSGHTGKLGKAVTGMAQTVVSADKDVKASKPAEGFTGWLRSFIGTEKNEQDSAKQQATPQTAGETIASLNTAKNAERVLPSQNTELTGNADKNANLNVSGQQNSPPDLSSINNAIVGMAQAVVSANDASKNQNSESPIANPIAPKIETLNVPPVVQSGNNSENATRETRRASSQDDFKKQQNSNSDSSPIADSVVEMVKTLSASAGKQNEKSNDIPSLTTGADTVAKNLNPVAPVVNIIQKANAEKQAEWEKPDLSNRSADQGQTSIVQSLSETVKGFVSAATQQNQRRDSFSVRQNPATARKQMAGAYQWGSYPKKDGFGLAPSSPADNAAGSERPESKLDQWLNSSSLADGFRGMMARIIPKRTEFTGGGLPSVNMSAGSAASPGGAQDVNSVADVMAARAMNFFKRISRRPESEGGDDQQEDNQNQQVQNTPSFFQNAAQSLRRTIGRQGRRILAKNFRNRVQRGQGMIRGRVRVMPAGGGGAPPVGNNATGWPKGTASWANVPGVGSGGGAAGAGGAGGGSGGAGVNAAGGAAAGGASGGGGSGGFFSRMAGMFGGGGGAAGGGAAGGGAAGGMAGGAVLAGIAGLVLGFVALAAVVVVAVNSLAKLGMQGYETALRVAQFDGQLSAAKAQLDVSRLMRDIGTARTLSESGAGFMKALDKMEAALRPITDGALNVGLVFLTHTINLVTEAFTILLKSLSLALRVLDFQMMGAIPNDLIRRMDQIAAGNQQNPPQNLPPAGFHNMFQNLPPAAPPRPPLAPLGGP